MSEFTDKVDELLQRTFDDAVPDDVMRQLRSQLMDFRVRITRKQPRSSWWHVLRQRPVWISAAASVAVLLIVVAMFASRPRTSFAEVVAAVKTLPWIHVVTTDAGGDTREVWYSASEDASASRSEDWIEFHDHRLKTYWSYDVQEKVLYRVPEYTPQRLDQYALLAESLRILLQTGQPPEKPLERLRLLGVRDEMPELLEQTLDRVEEGGRQWFDYHLTVRYARSPEPVRWLFRVDPQSMLPQLSRAEGKWEGKLVTRVQHFHYPKDGPRSIYDLGAPQTAKLVDRVPSDDIVRILDTLRAGRERMDDYRAIVVDRFDDPAFPWWLNLTPYVLYRKGDKTRSDFLTGLPQLDGPLDHAGLEKWLRTRLKDSVTRPVYLTDGGMTYHVETDVVADADGKNRLKVTGIKSWRTVVKPGDMFPPYWSFSPEFVCRPPIGVPRQELEPRVDTTSDDGPPGTILLRVARSGRIPGAAHPKNLPPLPDAYRYWFDPARDFVALRWDMLAEDESGKEQIASSTVIEELKQSPRGIWYATRFRVKAVPPVQHDQIFDVFIDFDAEMPDDFFELPRVGQILAEYPKH